MNVLSILQQDPKLNELESLLAFFASFVLDTKLVADILRWDMTVLRESPWYQEILKEGLKQGEQQGRQEGRQEEGISLILRQLNKRLGTIPTDLEPQIRTLSLTELESLGEALLDFAQPTDLEQWLRSR